MSNLTLCRHQLLARKSAVLADRAVPLAEPVDADFHIDSNQSPFAAYHLFAPSPKRDRSVPGECLDYLCVEEKLQTARTTVFSDL